MRTAAGGALFCTGFALGAFGASLPGHHEHPPAVVSLQVQKAPQAPAAGPYRAIHRPVTATGRIPAATGTAAREPARSAVAAVTPTPGAPASAPASVQSAATAGLGPGNGTGLDISLSPLGLLAAVADPLCILQHRSTSAPAVDRTFGTDLCHTLRQPSAHTATRQAGADPTPAAANVRTTPN